MSDYGWHWLMWTVMILSFSENTAGWFYNQYNYCCHVSTPIYYTNLLPTLDSNHSVTVQYYSWAIQHDVEWSSEPVHRVCYTLSLSVLNGGRHLVWRSTNLCECKRGDPRCRGVTTPSPKTDWLTDWLTDWINSSMMYLFTCLLSTHWFN